MKGSENEESGETKRRPCRVMGNETKGNEDCRELKPIKEMGSESETTHDDVL